VLGSRREVQNERAPPHPHVVQRRRDGDRARRDVMDVRGVRLDLGIEAERAHQVFGERRGDGPERGRADHEQLRPPEEKRGQTAERLADVDVDAPRTGEERGELRVGERAAQREQAPQAPLAEHRPRVGRAAGGARGSPTSPGPGEHCPRCNGKLLPPLDLPTMIEYAHRLVAAAVSVLVAGLAGYASWLRRRAGSGDRYLPGIAPYVALALLVVQVVLGAVTVKLRLPPWTVILHLGTAMLLLATLIVIAKGTTDAPRSPGLRPGLVALVLGFVTVLFGALTANLGAATACLGFPLCNGQLVPAG